MVGIVNETYEARSASKLNDENANNGNAVGATTNCQLVAGLLAVAQVRTDHILLLFPKQ
jgi:hypothetical protein